MKTYLSKFFKSFTPYQIIYLTAVMIITILFVIFLPDEMLEDTSNTFVVVCSVIAVLANPVCELLISKQSKLNFLVSVIFVEIPETVLLLSLGYYTSALVTIIFWIPIDIASYVKWCKYPDAAKEEETVVKRLTPKQDVLAILAIIAFSVVVGTLISFIPGAEDSYIDALASAFGIANGILLFTRYSEQWYAWFITLLIDGYLYIISGSYIMLITIVAMLVNTVYGFVKWYIYTKEHPELSQHK